MQAKPFNIIPTTMFHHLPPLKSPLSCAIRLPKDNKSRGAFDDYHSLFTSQRLEACKPVKLALVDGVMPRDFPMGTYYLIGPGVFTDDHGSTVHPLDGHGYLRAFEINGPNGEVKFSAQYVRTAAQMEEFDAVTGSWKFTHRGPFSVLKGGKVVGNTKVMKNVANTTVLKWGGRLFCLWEGGAPYEVQPGSLDTLGRFDLINGDDFVESERAGAGDALDVLAALLKPILYGMFKMPKKRILSHYKIDVERQRLLIMACNAEDMLLPRSHVTFYEFDKNFKLIHKREFKMSEQLMVHDWGFTATHYVVFGNRVKLNFPGFEWQSGKFDPSMMNRDDEQNLLPHLIQVSIDLDGSGECSNSSVEPLSMWTRPSDLPVINPRCHGARHQYIYAATSSGSHQALPNFPFDSVVKLDTRNRTPKPQVWSTIQGRFIGEPMFIPKPMSIPEDDGYLLVVEYAVSQGECYLVMIDARQIGESNALVARFAVPKYLTFPLGFHGVWDPLE